MGLPEGMTLSNVLYAVYLQRYLVMKKFIKNLLLRGKYPNYRRLGKENPVFSVWNTKSTNYLSPHKKILSQTTYITYVSYILFV